MRCPKCQFENRETVKFCEQCGIKLELVCPSCSAKLPLDRKFCGECGHDLTAKSQKPPVDYSQPQTYTPKYLADKILTTRSSIEGERKLVTVLFADVANYTSIAEKLDPEEIHQIMDGCFKILMDEIHKYEGTINQFTGDGIMALFGAPVAHEDHAQRACYAALSIQKALVNYEKNINKDFGVEFKMRIGLNSGPVIVGSIGDDLRMDYTAVGDTTNLAARIESMANPGTIYLSVPTYKLTRDFFEFRTLGKVAVKGKEEPQEIFELLKTGKVESRIEASVAKGLTRFVGRKNSMAALTAAFDKTNSGSGQIVGIVGDAGVGKSRLLLEFKNRLPRGKFVLLEGRCLQYGSSMAYLPVLDMLRSYFGIKEGDQESLIKKSIEDKILQLDEKLLRVRLPFHELLSLAIEDEAYQKLEPMQKREKTYEALRDLFLRESQNRSVILVIEDLHWIDKSSEEFLDYLIGWLPGSTILLLLLYRPEYTHPWGSKSYYNRIGLDQLSKKSSTELIHSILGEGRAVPELKELILDRAAGNPLYMEEFTHKLVESGAIRCEGQTCMLTKDASGIQVPDTIQGIIAARMDRLEDDLKRTMQVASVIGRDFAFRILQTIMDIKQELKSCLLNLQGLEFIYEKSLFPELEYVFKHALTQEVAYNSLLQKRRKEIHEKVGQAIEALWPERLEEFYEMLAYHYSKSENPDKAYKYLKLSGNKATKNYANSESLGFYKKAINVLNKMPETEENKKEQIEVRISMAGPMLYLSWPEGSIENLRAGERISKELGDKKSLAYLMALTGVYYAWKKGELLKGIKYCEDSYRESEEINDIGLIASAGGYLCLLYWWAGECRKSVAVSAKVIALLEKTQRQAEYFGRPFNLYSVIHAWYANCTTMLGNFEKAKALLEKGLDFGLKNKDIRSLAVLELQSGFARNFMGEGKEAIAHLQNCIKYCEQGFFYLFGITWVNLGWSYFLLGDLKTAREFAQKGLKFHSGAENQADMGFFYLLLSMIDLELGELENAQNNAEKALKLSQNMHQKWIEGLVWIHLGRISGKRRKPKAAEGEESIQQGIKVLDELELKALYAPGYHCLGEIYADSGQNDKALESLNRAEKLFQEMGMDYWLEKTHELLKSLTDSSNKTESC